MPTDCDNKRIAKAQTFTRAAKDRRLSHGAVRLFVVLHSHADSAKGTCFPGHKCLAEEMGCSNRKIRPWVDELVAAGYVTTATRSRGGTWYRLNYLSDSHAGIGSDSYVGTSTDSHAGIITNSIKRNSKKHNSNSGLFFKQLSPSKRSKAVERLATPLELNLDFADQWIREHDKSDDWRNIGNWKGCLINYCRKLERDQRGE